MKVFKEWNIRSGPVIVKVMLEELVKRKDKLEKMEKAKMRWSLYALFCLAILFLLGFQVFSSHHVSFNTNVLSLIVTHPYMLFLLLLLSIGFIQIRFFTKKSTKAEKEFEALREELIIRSTELWEEDIEWEAREDVFSYMKKEFDINLYHK